MIPKHIIIALSVAILFVSNAFCQAGYCPRGEKIDCFRRQDLCCSDKDCPGNQLCCGENCGNVCRSPRQHGAAGRKYLYDETCVVESHQK